MICPSKFHSRPWNIRGRGEKCGRLGQHLDISWLVRLQFSMFYQHIWWYHPICKQDTKRTFAKSKFYLCWWKINWTFFWFSLNFTFFSSTLIYYFFQIGELQFPSNFITNLEPSKLPRWWARSWWPWPIGQRPVGKPFGHPMAKWWHPNSWLVYFMKITGW